MSGTSVEMAPSDPKNGRPKAASATQAGFVTSPNRIALVGLAFIGGTSTAC